MKKLLIGISLIIMLGFTSCEPDDINTPTETTQITIYKVPNTLIISPIRVGKILELYTKTLGGGQYWIKTDKSINAIQITKEWYDKAKVGYTISYIEYPTEIISIQNN